jgi:hypothetical protein
MPEEMYGFTASERAEFLRLAVKIRNLPQSGGIRSEDIVYPYSSETHLVKFPASGIAPLDLNGYGTGTASGSSGADVPGSGICRVHRFWYNQLESAYEIQPVEDFDITVLNITPSYIFEGYGTVTREKISGAWMATTPWITRWQGKTVNQIASKGSGLVNIWINDLVSSPLWQVTAWNKWMNGTSVIAAGKEVLIEWMQNNLNTDGTLGQWLVHEVEC